MTNWQTKKLGQIAKVQTGPFGAQLHEKDYVKTGGTPILTVENLVDGVVKLLPGTPKVSDEDKRRLSRYILSEGDIVFSRVGAVDRSAYVTGDSDGWMFSGRLLRVHPGEDVDAKYLNYHFSDEHTKNLIRKLAVGGTMPSLNTEILNFVPISYPEKPEQERIVGVLEVWDEYIEKLEQKIALKEQLKKGLMQQLLTGKRRLPGFGKEWRDFKMNELGITYSGLAGKTKDDFGSGEPFITYMNIYSNQVLNTKNMQLVHIGENERQSIAEYGDIFFTTSSETPDEVGISSVLLDKSDQNIYLNSFCFGFRMNNRSTLDPRFAAYYFRSSIFRKKMTRIAQGASRYNLSKKYFMETEIRVPELDEQLAIVVLLENIDKQIAVHSVQYKNLKIQKKYLLKNLITGTIRTPEDLQPLDSSRLERSAL